MKKILFTLLWVAVLTPMLGSPVHSAPAARVTAEVVDENGTPIQGADVTVGYTLAKKGGLGTDDYRERGKSDKDGLFTATGSTIIPQVTIHAEFEGYYRSSKWAEFKSSTLSIRWEPWNPTVEVVLKKKRNPVPMIIAGTDWVSIPKLGAPVGYDIEKSDWVTPYGNGIVADLTIEFNLDYRDYTDYDANMNISFPNDQDGIQEFWFDKTEQSSFKWPFEAPTSGYLKSVNIFVRDNPKDGYKTNIKEGVNYLFRIRTKLDKTGNIISANYGKFNGEFGISRKGKTRFTYVFNPDGTRNLEEDPEKNLFQKK